MTEIPTIAEGWQEDAERHRNSYDKVRAVRELTAHCPCDRCQRRDACKVTHHECNEFKRWCKTGTTKKEES